MLDRYGWAGICPAAAKNCTNTIEPVAAEAEDVIRFEFEHMPTFPGMRGRPARLLSLWWRRTCKTLH
jgi:hypothetical protein